MFGVGMWEVVLILVVALLVFGPNKLPELARQLGKGLAEFRRASTELRQSVMTEVEEPRRPPPPARGPADEMAEAAPPSAPAAATPGPAGAEPVEPAAPKPG